MPPSLDSDGSGLKGGGADTASPPTPDRRKKVRIANLPAHEKPRERLWRLGPTNVTTRDLLAVILGHGTRGQGVLSLARRAETWLAQTKLDPQPPQTTVAPGLGRAQSLKIVAVQELCRRSLSSQTSIILSSPKSIVQQVPNLAGSKQEQVIALYVDARFQLIDKRLLALGRQNAVQLETRDVFAPALTLPAYGLALVHNHPSGNPEPSEEDFVFTNQVVLAGKLLGVTLIDHIIVAKNNWYSFSDHGLNQLY